MFAKWQAFVIIHVAAGPHILVTSQTHVQVAAFIFGPVQTANIC